MKIGRHGIWTDMSGYLRQTCSNPMFYTIEHRIRTSLYLYRLVLILCSIPLYLTPIFFPCSGGDRGLLTGAVIAFGHRSISVRLREFLGVLIGCNREIRY